MNKLAVLCVIIPILQLFGSFAHAQGYQPLAPGYGAPAPLQQSSVTAAGIGVTVEQALGRLLVHVPTDTVSFDQLQSVIRQFPGADKLEIQFPNQSQWSTSPSDILNMHSQFMQQASGLGFGASGTTIPQMIFSSLAGQAGLSGEMGGAKELAMIPITTMKGAMSDTLAPVLSEMSHQQQSFMSWLPDWLRNGWNAIADFVMPYYYSASDWIGSFF